MGMTPIFNEKLEKITLRFPLDVNQWVNDRGDISTVVRKIIDSKFNLHEPERATTNFPSAHIGADPGKTSLKALMKKFEKEGEG